MRHNSYIWLSVVFLVVTNSVATAENDPQFLDISKYPAVAHASLQSASVIVRNVTGVVGHSNLANTKDPAVITAAVKFENNNSNAEKSTSIFLSKRNAFSRDDSLNKDRNSPACPPSPLLPDEIARLVALAADRHGVNAEFAEAIAWTESRFDQVRNSPKGARGPMQLMPGTASGLGVRDICDPAENIDGGVRHLRLLSDRLKNPILVAAAYNAGEQAIYDNNGVPPYPETLRYVASVINRQLGIDMSRKRPGFGRKPTARADDRQTTTAVLGAPRTMFIGGVMQFSRKE